MLKGVGFCLTVGAALIYNNVFVVFPFCKLENAKKFAFVDRKKGKGGEKKERSKRFE